MNTITSRKNPLAVHLKKLGADSDYRRDSAEFLCDGEKLLREAVQSGTRISAVLSSVDKPDWLPSDVPFYSAPQEVLDAVSPLKTPQKTLFSCAIPERTSASEAGLILILDGIQDPGNVGTILRTANAFGVGRVLLVGGCADPYSPKTVRATMGAIFRQPFESVALEGIRALKASGVMMYGAALGDDCIDVRDADVKNAAVVIGSEGQGISPEMLKLCDRTVKIPMSPASESLNAAVAAAVIMWEAGKGKL